MLRVLGKASVGRERRGPEELRRSQMALWKREHLRWVLKNGQDFVRWRRTREKHPRLDGPQHKGTGSGKSAVGLRLVSSFNVRFRSQRRSEPVPEVLGGHVGFNEQEGATDGSKETKLPESTAQLLQSVWYSQSEARGRN